MEKDAKDTNDGIDDETVDLFALMNSSIMELQMELEILESREYERDDHNQNNDDEIKHIRQDDTSASVNDNDIQDTEIIQEPPIPLRSPINETVSDTINKTISTTKPKTTSVDWQAMEPAKVGDHDYAPVSDYSPGKTMVVAGVTQLESDSDNDDDDDDDSITAEQLFAPVTPAKEGDEDYVPVADYTKTANAETIANAIVKVTSKTKLRESEQQQKKSESKETPGKRKPKEARIPVCGLFQEPESLGHFTRL